VQAQQCVGDVLRATQTVDESRRRILDRLEALKQVGRQVDQLAITVISHEIRLRTVFESN